MNAVPREDEQDEGGGIREGAGRAVGVDRSGSGGGQQNGAEGGRRGGGEQSIEPERARRALVWGAASLGKRGRQRTPPWRGTGRGGASSRGDAGAVYGPPPPLTPRVALLIPQCKGPVRREGART